MDIKNMFFFQDLHPERVKDTSVSSRGVHIVSFKRGRLHAQVCPASSNKGNTVLSVYSQNRVLRTYGQSARGLLELT